MIVNFFRISCFFIFTVFSLWSNEQSIHLKYSIHQVKESGTDLLEIKLDFTGC